MGQNEQPKSIDAGDIPITLVPDVNRNCVVAAFERLTQRIMTWMIKSGELERQIRRARRHYRSRRPAMLGALGEILEVASVSGQSAGTATARLKNSGILFDRVSDFQLAKKDDKCLLLAYGHLTEREIANGIRKLARALESDRKRG